MNGAPRPWRALLRGVAGVRAIEGGVAHEDPLGALLIPAAPAAAITARL